MKTSKRVSKRVVKVRTVGDAFGILNQFNEFWTHQTWLTSDGAREYLMNASKNYGGNARAFHGHRVVPVRVTITYTPKKSK